MAWCDRPNSPRRTSTSTSTSHNSVGLSSHTVTSNAHCQSLWELQADRNGLHTHIAGNSSYRTTSQGPMTGPGDCKQEAEASPMQSYVVYGLRNRLGTWLLVGAPASDRARARPARTSLRARAQQEYTLSTQPDQSY